MTGVVVCIGVGGGVPTSALDMRLPGLLGSHLAAAAAPGHGLSVSSESRPLPADLGGDWPPARLPGPHFHARASGGPRRVLTQAAEPEPEPEPEQEAQLGGGGGEASAEDEAAAAAAAAAMDAADLPAEAEVVAEEADSDLVVALRAAVRGERGHHMFAHTDVMYMLVKTCRTMKRLAHFS